jgi:hypothetical protein
VTPAGASAQVTVPHAQRRPAIWCSVTTARGSGTSVTCRLITPASGAPASPAAHDEQQVGSCRTTASGRSLNCIVAPGCPFGLPGLRPDFPRSDFGVGFASPSDDGGLELFREFCPSRAAMSATCASSPAARSRSSRASAWSAVSSSRCPRSTSISASRSASSARSRAFAVRSRAASSGTGSSGTSRSLPHPHHSGK